MADGPTIDTVRSRSVGLPGRALNSARTQHFVLDSPGGPNEALTTVEAFLAGISACGVTLIEKHARETEVPLRHLEVKVSGVRGPDDPTRFQRIDISFEIAGVDAQQAARLVEVWQAR
ncbi:MAG TPA: OsmC family protein [Methylomirabilota bacterium]|jgi:uncharacterized OsmC-like protein|nr:OsmC family protein [Methylomirabilota bacterium]